MSSPFNHVAAADPTASETASSPARRFLTQSICALVVLPLGLMAAVSVVRELAASREPVSGVVYEGRFDFATLGLARGVPRGEYIATASWAAVDTDGESLTQGGNRLAAELASPERSPLRLHIADGAPVEPVWRFERCRCASP